jgi:hypothetical protein
MRGNGGSAVAAERADERGNVRESILFAIGDDNLFERNSASRTNDNVSLRSELAGNVSVLVMPFVVVPNVEITIGPSQSNQLFERHFLVVMNVSSFESMSP